MNTLIYKRTHRGDPGESGVFGVDDCMGQDRGWDFDAVIGVGGKSPWPGQKEIAHKVNWIGINANKTKAPGFRGPLVTFEYFVLYDENGPELKALAPSLFKHMFEDRHVRTVMSQSLPRNLQKEITKILGLAEKHQEKKGLLSEVDALSKHKC